MTGSSRNPPRRAKEARSDISPFAPYPCGPGPFAAFAAASSRIQVAWPPPRNRERGCSDFRSEVCAGRKFWRAEAGGPAVPWPTRLVPRSGCDLVAWAVPRPEATAAMTEPSKADRPQFRRVITPASCPARGMLPRLPASRRPSPRRRRLDVLLTWQGCFDAVSHSPRILSKLWQAEPSERPASSSLTQPFGGAGGHPRAWSRMSLAVARASFAPKGGWVEARFGSTALPPRPSAHPVCPIDAALRPARTRSRRCSSPGTACTTSGRCPVPKLSTLAPRQQRHQPHSQPMVIEIWPSGALPPASRR